VVLKVLLPPIKADARRVNLNTLVKG
jgi:hypothetical protein